MSGSRIMVDNMKLRMGKVTNEATVSLQIKLRIVVSLFDYSMLSSQISYIKSNFRKIISKTSAPKLKKSRAHRP